jgi:Cu2+-exporting ATPase
MAMAPSEAMGHSGHAGMSMSAMASDMRNRFLVALVLSIPMVLWSPIGRQLLGFELPAAFGLRDDLFQLILSLPVVFYSARVSFEGAIAAVRQKTLDMTQTLDMASPVTIWSPVRACRSRRRRALS